MIDFILSESDFGGFLIISLFFVCALFFRMKDCIDSKRNFVTSLAISFSILFLNLITLIVLFFGFGYLGGYLKSLFYLPFYIQFFYFVFCFVLGLFIFSRIYILLNKFYLNYLEKGIFKFKRKSENSFD